MTMQNFPQVDAGPGVLRQVLADHPELMIVQVCFEKGAFGDLHSHLHVQSTYVAAGRFEFTVGEQTRILEAGEGMIVPSGIPHGCTALEAGRLIDTFTPRRDDFL